MNNDITLQYIIREEYIRYRLDELSLPNWVYKSVNSIDNFLKIGSDIGGTMASVISKLVQSNSDQLAWKIVGFVWTSMSGAEGYALSSTLKMVVDWCTKLEGLLSELCVTMSFDTLKKIVKLFKTELNIEYMIMSSAITDIEKRYLSKLQSKIKHDLVNTNISGVYNSLMNIKRMK